MADSPESKAIFIVPDEFFRQLAGFELPLNGFCLLDEISLLKFTSGATRGELFRPLKTPSIRSSPRD